MQRAPGAVFLGVKEPVHKTDHSPQSTAEVKNAWSYTITPPYVFRLWCIIMNRENYNFYVKGKNVALKRRLPGWHDV
jgi:hypothetical protein